MHPVERISILKDRVIVNRQGWGEVCRGKRMLDKSETSKYCKLDKSAKERMGGLGSQVEETELDVPGTGAASGLDLCLREPGSKHRKAR